MSTCERRIWYNVLVGMVVCVVRSMLIGNRCGMFDATVCERSLRRSGRCEWTSVWSVTGSLVFQTSTAIRVRKASSGW
jgi:hypothetical protein